MEAFEAEQPQLAESAAARQAADLAAVQQRLNAAEPELCSSCSAAARVSCWEKTGETQVSLSRHRRIGLCQQPAVQVQRLRGKGRASPLRCRLRPCLPRPPNTGVAAAYPPLYAPALLCGTVCRE